MKSRANEIAKFACGFESFHALFHAYLWASKTTITFLGFTLSPSLSGAAAAISAAIAIGLGVYAWRGPTVEFP